MNENQIIIRPILTEKFHLLSEKGEYVFEISKKANKMEVKKAIEKMFKVNVDKVKIVNLPQKEKRWARIKGKTKGIKKAIVKLKKGQKIEAFK